MVTPPAVSLIIVNHNGASWLERCLPAALAETSPDCELIVVDNGSTDGSVALLESRFPMVRVERLPENQGFAGGNNAGARLSRASYLAFVNNDAAPQPGWLSQLRGALEQNSRAAIAASCIVYLHDPQVVDSAGDGFTRLGGAFKRFHGQPASEAQTACEVFGACGAACLIRRAVFDELGGFDPAYFAVHEDVDLSYRCQLLGHRCLYVPSAVVHHAGSGTLGRLSTPAVFWGQRNLEWTYFKNTPWPLLVATLPGHVLYNIAAAIYFARSGHFGTFVQAKLEAAAGLPRVWQQRRVVQRSRRVSSADLWRRMSGGWLRIKMREKQFDLRLTSAA
jgi:GT2 family glycosyltransferase